MTDARIVVATPDEYPLIERIARRTWPSTFGSILSPAQIDYMLERMYSPGALAEQTANGHVFLLLLARYAHRGVTLPAAAPYAESRSTRYGPVGYLSYQLDYAPGVAKIHKLYLLPDNQGRGFGRQLLHRVERIATNAGQHQLRLDVNYRNPAVAFYERLGFRKIDRHDTDIGNGYLMEDWRMGKELAVD